MNVEQCALKLSTSLHLTGVHTLPCNVVRDKMSQYSVISRVTFSKNLWFKTKTVIYLKSNGDGHSDCFAKL